MFHRRFHCIALATLAATPPLIAQTHPDITFDRYHDYAAQQAIVRRLAQAYPDLLRVGTYGKSYQGRDLVLLSVTNVRTGPMEEKPAFMIVAAFDGGETFTTDLVLFFLNHLLTRYGADPNVTELLDTRGFYILPNANPDAGEQLYQKPTPGPKAGPFMGVSRNAWLVPYDDDGDGTADEDPPEDLNGDGLILQMRVPDPAGHYVTDERDPRLLRTRKPWESGQWTLFATEGVDSDGDGAVNEDWYGGYDTNRNMPSNWDPYYINEEVAPYPLFVPESKNMADLLLAKPNVYALLDVHTAGIFPGGTLWVVPNSRPPSDFPRYDQMILFPVLSREYERLMRRAPHSQATATSAYIEYGRRGRNLAGLLTDYAYINLGMMAWVQENNVREPDYDDDGNLTEFERLRWNDTELKEKIFVNWTPFRHPALGEVEIGGWKRTNDSHGYTPVEQLAWHAGRIMPWYLAVARMAPLVRVLDPRATALGNDLYTVSATVKNVGVAHTYVTEQALKVRTHGPTTVTARIEGTGITVLMGDNPADLGHLRGNQPGMTGFLSSGAEAGESRTVQWLVRASGRPTVTITAGSSKAGMNRARVTLGR
ncbi:MAG TPA: M14 family metallopeptidase [Gemmatimonadales bacterium]|nr:M14 family metallopeptidase [Gemmatimonadales bacterium]